MNNTIKEVAKEANVSIATVSRVLNGKDKVRRSTRLKIEEAIKKLNFQPNTAARTMVIKKTKTIGLIVPKLSNEYWALLSETIQEKLWIKGYSLVLCSTDARLDREENFLKMLMEKRVDGIIYGSAAYKQAERKEDFSFKYIENVIKRTIPVVSLIPEVPGANYVIGDHLQGALDATKHLVRLGHRKIVHIGGIGVSQQREFGYRQALAEHGLEINEALIIRKNEDTFQYGYESMEQLLKDKADFTAVFCGNDMIAFGVIKSLEDAGLNVPGDVAVAGYDDINMAPLHKPALTTVKQPIKEMAEVAVDLLMESIEAGSEVKRTPKKVVFQMNLIIRESCGAKVRK
jgi:LacI family transcriptional regulator